MADQPDDRAAEKVEAPAGTGGPTRAVPVEAVIDYDTGRTVAGRYAPDEPVWLRRNLTAPEAHMMAMRLEAQGIASAVLDENAATLGPAAGFPTVKLQVRAQDVAAAEAALASDETPEPEDLDAAGNAYVTDPDGTRRQFVPLQTYPDAKGLNEAALVLGAARIEYHLPGEGPLVLRVYEVDLERAREVLADYEQDKAAEDDDDE